MSIIGSRFVPGMSVSAPRKHISLREYVTYRLGSNSSAQLGNWLKSSWGASSFAEFWRYFNPVYGYVLYYYSYRPLRRALQRPAAMWLTFVVCGFLLHDLVGWPLDATSGFLR
jgi:hypothetical protein